MIHLLDDSDDKEGILGEQVVVFQIHNNIPGGTVFGDLTQACGGQLHIRFDVVCSRNMVADARRPQNSGDIYPLFCAVNRSFTGGGVRIVKTVSAIYGNVDNVRSGFIHGLTKLVQVVRQGRTEVTAQRLKVVNVEFFDDVGGKIFQIHAGLRLVTILVVGTLEISAKRPGRDCNPFAHGSGKFNVRSARMGVGGKGCRNCLGDASGGTRNRRPSEERTSRDVSQVFSFDLNEAGTTKYTFDGRTLPAGVCLLVFYGGSSTAALPYLLVPDAFAGDWENPRIMQCT